MSNGTHECDHTCDEHIENFEDLESSIDKEEFMRQKDFEENLMEALSEGDQDKWMLDIFGVFK